MKAWASCSFDSMLEYLCCDDGNFFRARLLGNLDIEGCPLTGHETQSGKRSDKKLQSEQARIRDCSPHSRHRKTCISDEFPRKIFPKVSPTPRRILKFDFNFIFFDLAEHLRHISDNFTSFPSAFFIFFSIDPK